MKDVAALCRRVVVIAQGRVVYDGSLSGILDQFGGQKIITLQMSDGQPIVGLERYGEVLSIEPPRAKLRVCRTVVSEVLSALLAQHPVEDVSVEDPPLESIIAKVFRATEAEQ
jgi:ABC-2 type transport system ATP-binding protein